MINQGIQNKHASSRSPQDNLIEISILLEAKSPLLLGNVLPLGNVVSSLAYVAGSAWRGALASALLDALDLRRRSWQQPIAALPPEFEQIFDENTGAHFGFLYPVRLDATEAAARRALPIPLTARQCKLEPGFAGKGHGLFDGLRNRLQESLGLSANRLMACPHPGCTGRVERVRGYASRLNGGAPIGYQVEKVDKHSFIRVGLNRYTETAQDQFLYVQDALIHGNGQQEDQLKPLAFVGSWRGTAEQAKTFRTLLNQHLIPMDNNVYALRIGTARARGMGAVHLYLLPQPAGTANTSGAKLAARVHDFQLRHPAGALLDANYAYASITVHSLLLLLDNSGMPTTEITAGLLRTYCPTAPASLEVWEACTMLERQMNGGWSGAWGLPKPVMPAIAAGSVLVVRAAHSETDQFLRFLTEIEQKGLGENVTAGWGDVLICDPFHLSHDEGQVNRLSSVERIKRS